MHKFLTLWTSWKFTVAAIFLVFGPNIGSPAFAQISQDAVVGGGGTPGGSSGQLQYNNGGVFGGFTAANNCTIISATGAVNCNGASPGVSNSTLPWQYSSTITGVQSGGIAQINTFSCAYAFVPRLQTINKLGVFITTVGTTSIQLALYKADYTTGRPGALLSNTAAIVDTALNEASAVLGANKQVGPGGADADRDVWLCSNGGDSTVKFTAIGSAGTSMASVGDATLANLFEGGANMETHIYCQSIGTGCGGGTSTYNAGTPNWPASFAGSTWSPGGASTSGNNMPVIAWKPSSVP